VLNVLTLFTLLLRYLVGVPILRGATTCAHARQFQFIEGCVHLAVANVQEASCKVSVQLLLVHILVLIHCALQSSVSTSNFAMAASAVL
jgi:hypothetical protein